jgi:hypothetical protein
MRNICVYYQDEECKVCQLQCDYDLKHIVWCELAGASQLALIVSAGLLDV